MGSEEKSMHDRIARLTARARMVLRVLAVNADEAWITRMSRAEISEAVGLFVGEGVEPVHAARLVKECVDAGLAVIVGRDTTKRNVNEVELQYPPKVILNEPIVYHAVTYDDLTPRESAILGIVSEVEWGDDQRDWPSTSRLAAMASVSTAVVRKTLRDLTDAGYLKAEEGEKPYPMKYTNTGKAGVIRR